MSGIVSFTGRRSEKDKGNVGRLALLVTLIRDRIQLNPRVLHPMNEQTAAATLTNDRSIERREGGRGGYQGEWYSQDGSLTLLKQQKYFTYMHDDRYTPFPSMMTVLCEPIPEKETRDLFYEIVLDDVSFDHVSLLTALVRFIIIIWEMICDAYIAYVTYTAYMMTIF